MGQKAITIYTPPAAAPHVYAEDEAQHNRARFGGSGITDADYKLACTKVNNNTVRLASGLYCMQGYMLSVSGGTTIDLAVDSGTVGQNRRDLVVADFSRGGGETADVYLFRIVKGTATAGTPSDPALTKNNLGAGGSKRQEALYRINISGTTIESIERIAPYVGNYYA